MFRYLAGTKNLGILYWHQHSLQDLPLCPPPPALFLPDDPGHWPKSAPFSLHGYIDSDWAADLLHCCSISGMVFLLHGNTIAWRSQVQPSVSTSSTEAEFIAALDVDKLALYIWSVLDELQFSQDTATIIYKDNKGAFLMAQASRPTKQSRHIDIQHFALQDWVEQDLVELSEIETSLNAADVLTKATPCLIFTWHCDLLFGLHPPDHFHPTLDSVSVHALTFSVLSRGGARQTLG